MQKFKAIKYIRLSYTDDKTVESNSVSNQRKLIDDFLAQHPEIEVVCEKVDDGYSGVLYDRPAFLEMMEMIKTDIAKVISKYMKIDAQSMEIQITKTGVKGRGKTQSLYASIPILDLNK